MVESHTERLERLRSELAENLGEIEVLLRGAHPKESMTQQLGRMASIRQQVNRVALNAPSPDVRRSAETLAAAGQDIYARLMKGSVDR
jgi:hypothetical protein